LSFRIGDFAFLADLSGIRHEEIHKLKGIKKLVISTTVMNDHHKHLKLTDVVEIIKRISPEKAYLTHMNHRFDYDAVKKMVPEFIEPGYDGLSFEV